MEENESKTKVEIEGSEAEQEEENLLSLESLDSIIDEADPDFAKGLQEIGPDDPPTLFSEGNDLKYSLQDELYLWQHSRVRWFLQKVFPRLPLLSFKFKSWIFNNSISPRSLRKKIGDFFKTLPKVLLSGILTVKGAMLSQLQKMMLEFGKFSALKKLGFIVLLVTSIASIVLIGRIFTQGIIKPEPLFLNSLEAWSQETTTLASATKEMFYNSPRTAQNIFLMKKMMANIKRSDNSGLNPMGAFEFFVEGTASDVMIEIKDREAEMEDLFLRTIEEMTYDQLDTGEGKQMLCDQLKQALNQVLTKGHVRSVYYKSIIIKP